ncbi:hypothetical protein Pfo_014714 [Paulownia fortunei]|nr:hypothetical protein Pfo_014714 [Paulownia fortunei]
MIVLTRSAGKRQVVNLENLQISFETFAQTEMSAIYDNWERLVAAVLRKEQLWQIFHADSTDPSIRSVSLAYSSSFNLSSPTSDRAAGSWILRPASRYQQSQHPATYSREVLLQKNEEYEKVVSTNQFLGFNSLAFDSTSAEGVSQRGIQLQFEMLRKEKFAIPYRSVMDNGITTVVKRLRGAGVPERELEENMENSGSIRHENVAQDETYFSYEDEMLIIYEYQSQDSVSTKHGKKFGMQPLDWESRVRIAIAVARAIANTHSQRNGKHIKATDAFQNSQNNDDFSDLGLENMAAASIVIPTSGYRAPEVNYNRQLSQASDIYSFGVLLVELLTGAFPMNGNVVNRMHLIRGVTQKFLEAGTLVVFEFVPVTNPTALIQMWKMLLVAMWCVEEYPMQRPKLSDVVKMMEDIIWCPS